MSRAVVLDTGPLEMMTHRGGVPEADAAGQAALSAAIEAAGRRDSSSTSGGALCADPPFGETELAVELLEEAESDQTVDVITGREIEHVDAIIRHNESQR